MITIENVLKHKTCLIMMRDLMDHHLKAALHHTVNQAQIKDLMDHQVVAALQVAKIEDLINYMTCFEQLVMNTKIQMNDFRFK